MSSSFMPADQFHKTVKLQNSDFVVASLGGRRAECVNYNKKNKTVFLKINDSSNLENFKDSYKFFFSKQNFFNQQFIEKTNTENIVSKATKLIQYGWKKEAVPVINAKKSLIARFFEVIFG